MKVQESKDIHIEPKGSVTEHACMKLVTAGRNITGLCSCSVWLFDLVWCYNDIPTDIYIMC